MNATFRKTNPVARRDPSAARHAAVLWALLALFAFRVAAEPLQAWHPLAFLPPHGAWSSGALPYPLLLALQLVILAAAGWSAWRLSRGEMVARRRLGGWLTALGGFYCAGMAARLALGLTVLSAHPWFGKPVPAFFHLVLAGFVLVLGDYHWRHGR
jgi:hypothetical protein